MSGKHFHRSWKHKEAPPAVLSPTPPKASTPATPSQVFGPLTEFFTKLGVESWADLAGFFDSVDDAKEFATAKDVPKEGVVLAWVEACHRQKRALSQVVALTGPTMSTPSSSVSTVASTSFSSSSLPATQAGEISGEVSAAALLPVAENTMISNERDHQARALRELQTMWRSMGPRGLHWQAGSDRVVDLRWHFLVRGGQRATARTVAKHALAWRSWCKWVEQHNAPLTDDKLYTPDSLVLAQFLDCEVRRGATLGSSRLTSFRWLRQRLGLPFPVDDVLVADFAAVPATHTVVQATAMDISVFLNVLALVNRFGKDKSQEFLLVLFWCLACLRRLHLCKSALTEYSGDFIFGRCEQGKCKKKGIRPPFHWSVPHLPRMEFSFKFLIDVAERMGFRNFIVPSRAKATGLAARRWLPQPMGHSMTLRILRRVLQEAGLSETQAAGLSYNTCRRFLPTVANLFHFDRESSQALGSWVEDTSGPSSTAMPDHMSVHYADQKALSSGLVKVRAVTELFAALDFIPEAKAIIDGGSALLPVGSISWDLVAGLHRDHVASAKYTQQEKKQRTNKHDGKHKTKDHKHEHKRKDRSKAPHDKTDKRNKKAKKS